MKGGEEEEDRWEASVVVAWGGVEWSINGGFWRDLLRIVTVGF